MTTSDAQQPGPEGAPGMWDHLRDGKAVRVYLPVRGDDGIAICYEGTVCRVEPDFFSIRPRWSEASILIRYGGVASIEILRQPWPEHAEVIL